MLIYCEINQIIYTEKNIYNGSYRAPSREQNGYLFSKCHFWGYIHYSKKPCVATLVYVPLTYFGLVLIFLFVSCIYTEFLKYINFKENAV